MAIEFSHFQNRHYLEDFEPIEPPEPPPPPPPAVDEAPPAAAEHPPTNLLLTLPAAPLAPDYVAVGEPPQASVLNELPETRFQAVTQVQAQATVAANDPAPPAAAAAYVGEPPVTADWLAARETAFSAVRSDYEAQRAQAQATAGSGPGWVDAVMFTDESGHRVSASGAPTVFIADAGAAPQIIGYDEGGPIYGGVAGRHVEFSEDAFAAHYRAQGGQPLQAVAGLYDTDAATLLASHPEIWDIATSEHALNAGPAPAGRAMGDAGQLAMLDLYMADPQVAELIQRYGGSVAPATSGIALEQVRVHGQARYEQMTRLANAMQAVRNDYSGAMQQAMANGGPGWVEQPRMVTITDESGVVRTEPMVSRDESGVATAITERFFDPDRFTAWYVQQSGVANQAFASFYGQSHTQWGTDESGVRVVSSIGFDNPSWQMGGAGGPMSHNELVSLDPNHAPRLNDDRGVGFDLVNGWSTHHTNIYEKKSFLEQVIPIVFVAAVAWASAGTLGPSAAAGMGLTTTTTVAGVATTTLSTTGIIVSAAVAGAATSVASGIVNGNLEFKNILKGALSGALTAGLMQGAGAAFSSVREAGTAANVLGRMTVGGAVQLLMGGSLRDGALSGLAAGLSSALGEHLTGQIAASGLEGAERFAALTASKVLTSAVTALGNPDDPRHAFAQAFMDSVFQELPTPRVAQLGPAPSSPATVFDSEGQLNEGIIDTSAPPSEQVRQLQAALEAQGLPPETARATALDWALAAGADPRTVRGYFVPNETHDAALNEVLAERATLGAVDPTPAEADVGPDPLPIDDSGQVVQLPPVTVIVTGRRITVADDLAERIGGTLGELYQQGKDLAAQGLDLAAQGLSVLDIPALQDFQQRTRDYLNAKAEAGGLSEAEIIVFGTLYAANEALMPTNALDFAGGAGKGITAAATVVRAGGKADELAQAVRAESRVVSAATEARVAEVGAKAQAEGLEFINARNGSRGDWNAALNGQLKADAVYLLDNGHAYVTDSAGRVVRAEAILTGNPAARNGWQQSQTGHVGGDGYEGGHLIATLLGGAGERINLVPQLATVNRGEFRVLEGQLAQAVRDGKTVRVEVSPAYTTDSRVPSLIDVVYWIDGKPTSRQFVN